MASTEGSATANSLVNNRLSKTELLLEARTEIYDRIFPFVD